MKMAEKKTARRTPAARRGNFLSAIVLSSLVHWYLMFTVITSQAGPGFIPDGTLFA